MENHIKNLLGIFNAEAGKYFEKNKIAREIEALTLRTESCAFNFYLTII